MRFLIVFNLSLAAASVFTAELKAVPACVTINSDRALVINGQKVFPIGFTTPPPPDGKTPDGKNGMRVLRPVIEEIGSKSPLYPALVAPDSTVPVKVTGTEGMEFCVREADGNLFILACKREAGTAKVEFSSLPVSVTKAEVMYETPRTVEAKDGKFTDWFAPFEVHVYRFIACSL
jgi:hypothetical protein